MQANRQNQQEDPHMPEGIAAAPMKRLLADEISPPSV